MLSLLPLVILTLSLCSSPYSSSRFWCQGWEGWLDSTSRRRQAPKHATTIRCAWSEDLPFRHHHRRRHLAPARIRHAERSDHCSQRGLLLSQFLARHESLARRRSIWRAQPRRVVRLEECSGQPPASRLHAALFLIPASFSFDNVPSLMGSPGATVLLQRAGCARGEVRNAATGSGSNTAARCWGALSSNIACFNVSAGWERW